MVKPLIRQVHSGKCLPRGPWQVFRDRRVYTDMNESMFTPIYSNPNTIFHFIYTKLTVGPTKKL